MDTLGTIAIVVVTVFLVVILGRSLGRRRSSGGDSGTGFWGGSDSGSGGHHGHHGHHGDGGGGHGGGFDGGGGGHGGH